MVKQPNIGDLIVFDCAIDARTIPGDKGTLIPRGSLLLVLALIDLEDQFFRVETYSSPVGNSYFIYHVSTKRLINVGQLNP